MTENSRIRLRRGAHESTEGVTAEFVRRAIAEALETHGLADFVEWKTNLEGQLQILRIIANDMKTTTALSYTNAGSARVKLNELLEGLMATLVNVEQLMQPGDVGELNQQGQLLNRAFDQFRPPTDPQNEAVEADDFDDPIEQIFDGLDTVEVDVESGVPTRRRRNRDRPGGRR